MIITLLVLGSRQVRVLWRWLSPRLAFAWWLYQQDRFIFHIFYAAALHWQVIRIREQGASRDLAWYWDQVAETWRELGLFMLDVEKYSEAVSALEIARDARLNHSAGIEVERFFEGRMGSIERAHDEKIELAKRKEREDQDLAGQSEAPAAPEIKPGWAGRRRLALKAMIGDVRWTGQGQFSPNMTGVETFVVPLYDVVSSEELEELVIDPLFGTGV